MKKIVRYSLEFPESRESLIHVKGEFVCMEPGNLELHFPFWRPGRYEMGGFLKRVSNLKWFFNGKALIPERTLDFGFAFSLAKGAKLSWEYDLNCHTLDAGSSYVDEDLKYINPIQSFFYVSNQEYAYEVSWPEDLPYIGQELTNTNKVVFENEQALMDGPFFLSYAQETVIVKVDGVNVGVHFFGLDSPIDLVKIERDFSAFAHSQFAAMGGYPYERYDFFVIALPKLAYHGVEHERSCIILLGPQDQLDGKRYKDLLGVSSHELFHVYNVKGLRPEELVPYNFKHFPVSENLFIAEGITTYLGDYFLWKSGVFSDDDYADEINMMLRRYQLNHAYSSMSLSQGSFEYWADGYGSGPEHRNISIYINGAMWSMALDWLLLQSSNGEAGLPEVFRSLFEAKVKEQGKSSNLPFSRNDLRKEAGRWLSDKLVKLFFETAVVEPFDFLPVLEELMADFGFGTLQVDDPLYQQLGVVMRDKTVVSLHPESVLRKGGVAIGDELRLTIKDGNFTAVNINKLTGKENKFVGSTGEFDLKKWEWKENTPWKRIWKTRS